MKGIITKILLIFLKLVLSALSSRIATCDEEILDSKVSECVPGQSIKTIQQFVKTKSTKKVTRRKL